VRVAIGSWFGEAGMRPDAAPHDVHLAFSDRLPVLKRGASIVGPGHLEDAASSFDAFDSEAFAEAPPALKVLHKLRDRNQEGRLLRR
jgi:hypothetical protein